MHSIRLPPLLLVDIILLLSLILPVLLGYDLTRLFIGSEGTLGVITEVTLRLHPIPKYSLALRVTFPSSTLACAAARDALLAGINVGRCEMIDAHTVRIINSFSPQEPRWVEAPSLMFEVIGHSLESCQVKPEGGG
jgi:D-lactate dehydrogenase (cytochrome)